MRHREMGPRPLRSRFSLSCVVPVYNESESISHFLECLYKTVGELTPDFEIIVVNDGSTDGSGEEIVRVSRSLPLHYIELSRNFGKEIALQAGLDAANADCVVMLDADFQHPLEVIPELVERWRAGVDMVYAIKAHRDGESLFAKLGSAIFYRMLTPRQGVRIPKDAGDFRLLDRKVVEALRAMPERNRFMKGMYAWVGFKSEAIEFEVAPRANGKSKFNALKLLNLAITGMTSFSNTPLRVVTLVGAFVSMLAMVMGLWIVTEKLFFGQPIPGFATLGAAIFFFSGVQLVALGVVGEYVGRIFDEVKQRPRYLISRRVNYSSLTVTPRRRQTDHEHVAIEYAEREKRIGT